MPPHKAKTGPAASSATYIMDDEEKPIEQLRQDAVDGFFQIGQFACVTFGQFADAGAIGMHGPAMGSELVKLANNNPKFAKRFDLLLEAGPYAGFIAAALPFAMQILVNHKIVKAEAFANSGKVVPPEVLESRMKVSIAQMQMTAMAERKEAEDQLRKMQDEYTESMNGDAPSEETPAND